MAPSQSDSALESLVERVADDMARRWAQGERPRIEEYLDRHPELFDFPEAATELIYEEICLRQAHGEGSATSDVLERFPQWQAQLKVVLDCHQLMQSGTAAPNFPALGERLGDFRLVAELGRGVQGRVFLATQPALADRPVVLKLVPLLGHEHLSLARLQHTHIVPLYSVQDYPARSLRALCLPYFGGLTLAGLLEALRGMPPDLRTGRQVVNAIRQAQAASPLAIPIRGAALEFIGRSSYVKAVCWIGASLADALHYAHERGVLHFDLKPANVLLAADGQPMLLDFHLARGPLAPGAPPPLWLGGTPDYMAPEQRLALSAVAEGRPIPVAVENRADLFALGLLLYEMLGGAMPLPDDPGPELCRRNSGVTVGLADLLAKCLAAEPRSRYRDAAALADDLRRHLNHFPLRGVANRSLRERWSKWRRRRPHAALMAGLLAVLVSLGLGAVVHLRRQFDQAETALNDGRDHISRADTALKEGRDAISRQEFEKASIALTRGLALAEAVPFSGHLSRRLREQLQEIERFQAASELHQFVEHLRVLHGAETLPTAEAPAVEQRCRAFWQRRRNIRTLLAPSADAAARNKVRTDLLDLTVLWAALQVRLARPGEVTAARTNALGVLAEAEQLFGPSCVLYKEREAHAAALGLKEEAVVAAHDAEAFPPQTAWEHCAIGRALFQEHKLAEAAVHFDDAVKLQPNDMWANFHKGRCAYERGQFLDAVLAFQSCVALSPKSGWCYYNRGLSFAASGKLENALGDYNKALELEPKLTPAALSRGLLHLRQQRYAKALPDLQRALADGANTAATQFSLAQVYDALSDRANALSHLEEALRLDPRHKEAQSMRDRLAREKPAS
jgi:serine/threonine protein kinase/tetratricopeptide (TPR) repeat protein